ncbi:ABC transporter permease [Kibdelosporangium philippinense]|uniref:ABC transporter permease n=1 Tax=Kibdelosporangium philippinense TaxID=211113 RepID=A0ABS8ZBH4_9PSEU|nr:ABC transporter permease [Kibdelosporangium philippinense]MCE7004180.1 ABC transporter permease [Kibdelosporangium philippinense]
MIWVTWRQQRVQILAVFAVVAAVSVVLAVLRSQASSNSNDLLLSYMVMLIAVLPALVGMFVGAPLFAREIESGTHIFALSQSISRKKWLLTKGLMAGGSLAVAMFVLGVVAEWAMEPLQSSTLARMETGAFEVQGVVVGGYAILAFAVGATAGLVLRNTLAAMVVTLILYGAVLLTLGQSIRGNYAEPSYFEAPKNMVAGEADTARSWQVDFGYVDATGKQYSGLTMTECRNVVDPKGCLDGLNLVASYVKVHLPSQFWRFQFTELGLVLALSMVVLGGGAVMAKRRLT